MSQNRIIKFIKSFREGTLILIILALSILMSCMSEVF